MNPSPTVAKIKYVGLDVHAETIAVALADSSGSVRSYGIVPAHTHSGEAKGSDLYRLQLVHQRLFEGRLVRVLGD